ncbi:DUF2169 domain-containing protein [Polyangium sp. y55x31]|uniref:DUF2169 domain-containing protein n=1 Tax=Polyangium sp. y55x31 TaxID=3042688 RepID=UPI0024826873|nr:DUF2169 domain-containing protein [Polyangium sp. y55x31]MDI1480996.1 DUF2169 domain-containing protein [Polyangium sp. y55x31]
MPKAAPFRRILVAESPVRPPGERRAKPLPCHVGVLPWSVDRNWLSIFVVATFRFDRSAAHRPIPLEPAPPRRLHAGPSAPGEPVRIDDFVPLRLTVDLTLAGHVEIVPLPSGTLGPSALPRLAEVGLGARRLPFMVQADKPGRIPLRPPHTRTPHGREIDLGPEACHDGSRHDFLHPETFDLSVYQAGTKEISYEVDEVTSIYLAGLGPDPAAAWEIALPMYAPRALVDYSSARVRRGDVELFIDGVAIDLDQSTVDVTWRGLVETTDKPDLDVDRIVIGWAPPRRWSEDAAGAWDDVLRELPRGRFRYAVEREDAQKGEDPPALSQEELLMARYETWGHPNAAEPEMLPHEAAQVAAELAEQRWPRGEVLAKHGIDDYTWGIEERAWAQRLASVREEADGGPSAEYVRAYQRASQALATPREAEITPKEFVAIAAKMRREDPTKVLAKAGLGIAAFGRLERRFREKAAEDKAFAAELTRLAAEEEVRYEGPKLGEAREEGDR